MTSELNKEIKKEETFPPPAEELKDCQKQRDEYLAGWQRSRADFLNYKKEEMERFEKIIDLANQGMILKILPFLDNLYLAEKNLPEDLKKDQYVQGLLQIKVQLESLLKNQGIEPLETIGKQFDPRFHEVVEEIESDKETGIIVEEIQKGYLVSQSLLRPAKVKVSKNK
ncbi:nucleotide exchange factor GrpE [Candidatus Parcubacteria bacterium]|nr:nucleotide exchange factor GrpE [Patescibacteria group bacterium]MBU4466508.1 nucleotide exchange factor GrpE [Patescibacteria group bacterium]MCG2688796.1 nucleotide exchange factor GrpE [Candidatus Parcubacteria bacterium]